MMGGKFHRSGWPKRCSKLWIDLALPHETQRVEGHWRHSNVVYRDNLVRIVIDVPDAEENREWMREFKRRWKAKLEQLELWLVSYEIDID